MPTRKKQFMDNLPSIKPMSVIARLKQKYPGKWAYKGNGHWEHEEGYACYVAILGGYNGDDYVGSELMYYPKAGTPERVY